MHFAIGPYRVQTDTEGLLCPWCGDDQINNEELDRSPFAASPIVTCTDCHKVFTLGYMSEPYGDPASIGMISAADVRYIGQQLAKTY